MRWGRGAALPWDAPPPPPPPRPPAPPACWRQAGIDFGGAQNECHSAAVQTYIPDMPDFVIGWRRLALVVTTAFVPAERACIRAARLIGGRVRGPVGVGCWWVSGRTEEEIIRLPWRGQCGRAAAGCCARAAAALRC
jgi:hypothetical protein